MAADDAKKLILARRATFVAAALAGVSVACGKEPSPPPQPCLSVPMEPRDAEPEPPPQPCLTPMMIDRDAESDAPIDAGGAPTTDAGATTRSKSPDAGGPVPKPTPCLAPPLPTSSGPKKPVPPQPCLSVIVKPGENRR
jgi:hypothetical protein